MCIDPRVQKSQNQKLQGLRTGKGECPSLRNSSLFCSILALSGLGDAHFAEN